MIDRREYVAEDCFIKDKLLFLYESAAAGIGISDMIAYTAIRINRNLTSVSINNSTLVVSDRSNDKIIISGSSEVLESLKHQIDAIINEA